MKECTFTRGQIIFEEGSYPVSMFLIRSGKVAIYSDYKTEKAKLITVLGGGELLGEMGLIEVRPRSATAIALEDGTELTEITDEEFSGYFNDNPDQLLEILKQLSRRIRETNRQYKNACRTVYESRNTTICCCKRRSPVFQKGRGFGSTSQSPPALHRLRLLSPTPCSAVLCPKNQCCPL